MRSRCVGNLTKVYDGQIAANFFLFMVKNPGGAAELDDQLAAHQPLLLKPPGLLLGNSTPILAMKQRSVSRHLKVLGIY